MITEIKVMVLNLKSMITNFIKLTAILMAFATLALAENHLSFFYDSA
jgi:hypothetical protein